MSTISKYGKGRKGHSLKQGKAREGKSKTPGLSQFPRLTRAGGRAGSGEAGILGHAEILEHEVFRRFLLTIQT